MSLWLIQEMLTLSRDLDYQGISMLKTNVSLTRIFKHGFQLAMICQPTERHAKKPWTDMDLKHRFISTKTYKAMTWKRLWGKKTLVIGGFPSQMTSNEELWCCLCCQSVEAIGQTVELPMVWDATALTSLLWSRNKLRMSCSTHVCRYRRQV